MYVAAASADLTTLVVALMGGGIVTSYVAARAAPKQRELLVVEKEKGQVMVQAQILDDLREHVVFLREDSAQLKERIAAEKALRTDLQGRALILEERVKYLEELVRSLGGSLT